MRNIRHKIFFKFFSLNMKINIPYQHKSKSPITIPNNTSLYSPAESGALCCLQSTDLEQNNTRFLFFHFARLSISIVLGKYLCQVLLHKSFLFRVVLGETLTYLLVAEPEGSTPLITKPTIRHDPLPVPPSSHHQNFVPVRLLSIKSNCVSERTTLS